MSWVNLCELAWLTLLATSCGRATQPGRTPCREVTEQERVLVLWEQQPLSFIAGGNAKGFTTSEDSVAVSYTTEHTPNL